MVAAMGPLALAKSPLIMSIFGSPNSVRYLTLQVFRMSSRIALSAFFHKSYHSPSCCSLRMIAGSLPAQKFQCKDDVVQHLSAECDEAFLMFFRMTLICVSEAPCTS